MGKRQKRRNTAPAPTLPRWRARTLLAVVLVVIGAAGAWWLWAPPETSGGTPRLVLDRDTVDLGVLPFEARARVVFTLTNAGDAPLRIPAVPRVKAVKGC